MLRIVMGRQSLSAALLCLLPLFVLSVRPVCGQAVVCDSRELLISASYEDVLARMDGEEASRAMFASQKLQMTSYKPQPKDKADKAEEGVTKGKIDIVGVSCEFGTMCYLMSVRASEKETVIDVQLTQPVGMLRRQSYRYVVKPRGEDQTTISISHELDVVLMKRRLNLVNKIIKKVTYKKACEEVLELTEKMSHCVASLATRPKSKTDADSKATDKSNDDDDDAEEPADDEDMEADSDGEMAKNDEAATEPQKNAEDATKSNAEQSDIAKVDAEQAATKPNASEPTPSDTNSATTNPTPSPATQSPATLSSDSAPSTNPVNEPNTKTVNDPVANTSRPSDTTTPTPAMPLSPPAEVTPAKAPTAEVTQPSTPKKEDAPAASATTIPTANNDSKKTDPEDQKPKAPVLRITIEGVTVASGSMRIALFDKEDQYKNFDARNAEAQQGQAFRKVAVKVKKSGKLVYEFKDVPAGSYAIAAFHDKDGNQQLGASVIGLPNEPYGFSRDARGTFGAPKFQDAVIKFDESNTSFSFKIK